MSFSRNEEEEVETMKPQESIKQEIERTKSTYADDFLSNLAERLGATAKASVVFAEPVERDAVTVIPVAKARWGFGGGAGRKKDEDGAGGGGGVQVTPIGFIELRSGEARFRRIHTVSLPVVVVGAITGLVLLGSFFRRR
jgi:uncharacterized spore protein YtfJ